MTEVETARKRLIEQAIKVTRCQDDLDGQPDEDAEAELEARALEFSRVYLAEREAEAKAELAYMLEDIRESYR